ncbi:LPS translocon maturation chaperone LptM [Planctobacterium marinum]|uniref:LPS translocon maturation chaperone LptM n=1 Tax=Planctobacterium marinum TaxID=1631968 RepID=UPI001E40FAB8|nr:lipoprotein [Planctobacterium marinum]MCC2606856.1 lipoprotein [Planctobacterium marinum]
MEIGQGNENMALIMISRLKNHMRKCSFILLMLCLLTACGQRGPLFLPEEATQNQSDNANPPVPAAASEAAESDQPKE